MLTGLLSGYQYPFSQPNPAQPNKAPPKPNSNHRLFNIIQHPLSTMPLSIDHTTLVVPISKLDDLVKFLLAALEPLGLREWMRPLPNSVGLGDKTPFFWVTGVSGDEQTLQAVMQNEHFAFSAASKSLDPSSNDFRRVR
jgi:hypothetical protein